MKLATATLLAMATTTASASKNPPKKFTAKHRNSFVKAMKTSHEARGASNPISKNQSPTPQTLADAMTGDSKRARNLRKKVMEKAKPVPRKLEDNANNNGGYNNYQGYNSANNNKNSYMQYSKANADKDGSDDYFAINGDWENYFGFDVTQYSASYARCAVVQQYDDEVAAREDTPSVFATKQFAVIRFCPSQTCNGFQANPQDEEYAAWVEAQYAYYEQQNGGAQAEYYQNAKEQYEKQPVYYNGQYIEQGVFDRLKVNGANGEGCQSNYGEYMLEMEDYLDIMVEYHNERFEKYCETCEECMYDVYTEWLKAGGNQDFQDRKLKDRSDLTWKDDLESEEFHNARKLGGFDQFKYCPEYDTCRYYGQVCKQGVDESLTQYFDCTEVQRNNGMVAYIGPKCAADGHTITLGVYADAYCNEDISTGVSFKNLMGFELEGDEFGYIISGSLKDVIPEEAILMQNLRYVENFDEEAAEYYSPVDQMCIPCESARQPYEVRGNVDVTYYEDGEDSDEITELCETLYMASARCDKHYRTYSSRISRAVFAAEAAAQEDLSCEFIETIVMGNYDEYGVINSDNMRRYNPGEAKSGFLSDSMYWEEHGAGVRQVSPLQIFGLIATLAACAVLAAWSFSLQKSLKQGSPWRPRTFAKAVERQDSGVAMNRSVSDMAPTDLTDRNQSYYAS